MDKYKEQTNMDLGILLNDIKTEHDLLKKKMLNDYDKMESLEKTFAEINATMIKRLKSENNE